MKIKIFIISLFVLSLNLYSAIFKIDTNVEIVLVDKTSSTKSAAVELKHYLEKILKDTVAIVNEKHSKKSSIVLMTKDSKYASKLSFYQHLTALKDDSFIIKSEGQTIFIAGVNQRALFYGVYHFLEHYLGCKFLTNDFEVVPKKNSYTFSNIDDVQVPRFSYREIFSTESDYLKFATKCRLNGRLGHRSAEAYQDENFPKGRAIYNYFVSSQMIGNKADECNGQYDFSQAKVSNIALNYISHKLSDIDITQNDFILLEHEDRDSYCTNGLDGDTPGTPFLRYSTYVAENLKDIHLLYQAYQWSRTPPKQIKKLPKNMSIFFSPIEADFSKPLTDRANKDILADLKGWNRFGNDIFIWDYVTDFGGYFQPYPNLSALDADIKLFSSLKHVDGVFLQSSYGTLGGELAELRTWVFSKLLWNPNLDTEVLIKEFCDLYYGKASQDVRKYIRFLHKIHQKMDCKLLVKNPINAKYLQPEFLKYLEGILEVGLQKVEGDEIAKRHLLKLFSGIDYVRVLRGDNDKNLQKSKNRFKQFLKTTEGIEYFSEGGSIDTIKKIIDINRKVPLAPKEVKGLKEGRDWFDFQEYTLKLCCADLVEDKDSSDGVSAVMNGSLEDWGFQLDLLNFPKGKWDIFASVKVEFMKDKNLLDSANMAYRYGIHPTFIKGVQLFGQCEDNRYQSVKIGSIDTSTSNAKTVWLSPAKNKLVKAVYVDRIYIIKKNNKGAIY